MSKALSEKDLPIQTLLASLEKPVKQAIAAHLPVVKNKLDFEYLREWSLHTDIWREPKVSFDTFLDSPKYLGCGATIYPTIRKVCKQILHNKYQEAVFVAGIGSGKTTASELIALYEAHSLLCLRNPHKFYNLAPDKPITIINMGITATQALDVTFSGIKKFMEQSSWFLSLKPTILNGSIRFPIQNILLMSGNSKSTTPLGYNVFCAILDEAAFYMDNDNKQIAKEIYDSLKNRIVSRFQDRGLLIMISSPRYEGDFVMSQLKKALETPDQIYAKQLPIWKCKPLNPADATKIFHFNARTCRIENDLTNKKICKVTDDFDPKAEVWEIPTTFQLSFTQDPNKAQRDYIAIPSATIEPFMPQVDLVSAMFTDQASPVVSPGVFKFKERPLRVNYYIHIDLALNKKGKGDKAGFAMAHFDGWELNPITGEKQKKVVVDIAEQIKAGATGEIEFEDVRARVYALKKMGFNIVLCTFDQFQSADTQQILRSKGIKADYMSVDRTIEPYSTLKEVIYSGRVKCHKNEDLFEELRRLEITKANKIDHPPGGGKDIADAVCGAVYNVIENSTGDIGVATTSYSGNGPIQPGTPEYDKQREEKYKRLKELQDKGLL